MSGERKGMGVMVALVLSQAVHAVLMMWEAHPVYVAAALVIFTEAAWSFGVVTPWLNCFTLALFERLRLGQGRLVVKNRVHWELHADDRVIGWLPTSKGWRRHMRRVDGLT